MKRKSILYKDLEVSRAKEIYDESCKNILANKIILVWIMKSCMKEYKDCSIRDIADHYIEGIPEISQREVHRDEAPASDPGKIRGENTEDKAVNEGTVPGNIAPRPGNHQEGTEESEILRLLEVLFSTERELKEKEKILENEYGITMTYEEKEEVEKMCNLSEYVWEKGLREGREEGLRTGINYGELQNLVRMVLKKMRKDVSCEITAELFEEPVEKIRKIYEVAEKYAPEYDIESICRELAA